MGFWTAPFEVSDRSWVYEHHQDWLVHNAQGEPINIGVGHEAGKELLFILDTTNPDAQEYLRSTYHTLAREWGAQYIKLDFMDNTAVEGYYYRPHTTALEAQRIGLEIIRKAVGEHVLLDKDGSPMLTPVGLVDEGRLSQDTGHTFLRSKQAAPGIAARYYMQHNFFLSDPDAFTVSRQMIEERRMEAPLTLSEAEASVTLAAVSGGMFEIGDDLPTLGSDPERLSLLTNPDLLQMVKLGRAALPLDLLTYSSEDGQPAVFLLHEDQRQAMLTVFNWTEKPRSHVFSLPELAFSPRHSYLLTDVFHPEDHLSVNGGAIRIDRLAAHSVRLIKIIDESIPAAPPSISVTAPQGGAVGEDLGFTGIMTNQSVPALGYHWDFGDGVVTDGATATHTYTHAGTFKAHLTVEGVDGVSYQHIFPVAITGKAAPSPPRRCGRKSLAEEEAGANVTADTAIGTDTVVVPHLQRSLKLWHLVVYGIIIIQPTAPMSIYGVVYNAARGHVVTAILIAMVAMLFTAVSYGRMARVYPSAGSAYTYVGKELHPLAGYVVGWSMLMDYLLNPIICAIWCSVAAQNVLPQIPYAAWAVAFVLLFTGLNLRGVRTSGRVNGVLAIAMSIVVVIFLAYAVRYIALVVKPIGGQWLTPFYDPAAFSTHRLFHGTSIAVLTYIGFDGISTMSEEVENPRRNIMLATVLTCFVIGLLSALEVYVAQLAWPTRVPFPESIVDTAYVQVALRVGGKFLFQLLNTTLLVQIWAPALPPNLARRGCSMAWDVRTRCRGGSLGRLTQGQESLAITCCSSVC